jgi:uncharacterized protein YgbK (DUF1537 family)
MPKQLGLELVPNKAKPAIDVEIAQAEFRALKVIRNLSKDERFTRMDEILDLVRPMTIVAGEIVAMTKDQLAEDVKEKRDLFVQMRSDITRAKDAAKAIVDLISAAEARLAGALTNPSPRDN